MLEFVHAELASETRHDQLQMLFKLTEILSQELILLISCNFVQLHVREAAIFDKALEKFSLGQLGLSLI